MLNPTLTRLCPPTSAALPSSLLPAHRTNASRAPAPALTMASLATRGGVPPDPAAGSELETMARETVPSMSMTSPPTGGRGEGSHRG